MAWWLRRWRSSRVRMNVCLKMAFVGALALVVFSFAMDKTPLKFIWQLRRWWTLRVVLGTADYESQSQSWKDVSAYPVQEDGNMRYEYNYPEPDYYAYVWHGLTPSELCLCLSAMTTLKSLLPNASVSWPSGHAVVRSRVHFVLYYAVRTPEQETQSAPIISAWNQHGGSAQKVEFDDDQIWSHARLLRNRVKYSAFGLTSYSTVLLLDPEVFPVRNLDHVFVLGATRGAAQMLMAAPKADLQVQPKDVKQKTCRRSPFVSTQLLLTFPFSTILARLKQHTEEAGADGRVMDDALAVNYEFGCNEEIVAISRQYAARDRHFFKNAESKPWRVSSAYAVSFSKKPSPLSTAYLRDVEANATQEFKKLFTAWRAHTANVCRARFFE